ncbi:MAG: iron ABC transporter permease [Endomicrobiia bacterium]
MKKFLWIYVICLLFILNIAFSLFYNLDLNLLITNIINKNFTTTEFKILTQIRIPRVFASFFVGAALAITGCVLQSVFLNPLCEGYTLGIASCAGLGVIVGNILNLPLNKFFNSLLGVIFSLGVVFLLVLLFKKTVDISFILAGIVLNFFFSGVIILLTLFFDPYEIHYVLLWLLGGFSSVDAHYVYISCIVIVICIVILINMGDKFDVMILGKEKAISLGIKERIIKNISILICVIILSLCVSLSGIISFVGVIVPNVVKMFTGLKHKNWFFMSLIFGGFFVSLCDNLAKNLLYPLEIPISVFTGIIGSIFFLVFILKGNLYGNIKS